MKLYYSVPDNHKSGFVNALGKDHEVYDEYRYQRQLDMFMQALVRAKNLANSENARSKENEVV